MKAPVSNQKTENTGIAFVTRKIVTETTPITLDPNGPPRTMGQVLDEHLSEAAKAGDIVESVELHMAGEMWCEYQGIYLPGDHARPDFG